MVETYQRRGALAHFGLNALAAKNKPDAGIIVSPGEGFASWSESKSPRD